MAKKKDFQKEINKLMGQFKQNLKKFGKDASIFAKKGEKGLVKASKIGRLQLDIISFNMQKEKLYYDIGKRIASLRGDKEISVGVIKPYLQKIRKIETRVRNRKREISRVKKWDTQRKG